MKKYRKSLATLNHELTCFQSSLLNYERWGWQKQAEECKATIVELESAIALLTKAQEAEQ